MDDCLKHLVYYQISLAVTLWLSGVVVDWTFTPGGVDMHAHLFVYLLITATYAFIRVLNFRSWSQL